MSIFEDIALRNELQEQFEKINKNFDMINEYACKLEREISEIKSRLDVLESETTP